MFNVNGMGGEPYPLYLNIVPKYYHIELVAGIVGSKVVTFRLRLLEIGKQVAELGNSSVEVF